MWHIQLLPEYYILVASSVGEKHDGEWFEGCNCELRNAPLRVETENYQLTTN